MMGRALQSQLVDDLAKNTKKYRCCYIQQITLASSDKGLPLLPLLLMLRAAAGTSAAAPHAAAVAALMLQQNSALKVVAASGVACVHVHPQLQCYTLSVARNA
jgi:hypothetical protein